MINTTVVLVFLADCHGCSSGILIGTGAFFLEGTEDHVQHSLLLHLELVEHSEAASEGEAFVKVVRIVAREDDNPLFVYAFRSGIRQNFGSVQAGHFEVYKKKIEVFGDRREAMNGVVAGDHVEAGIVVANIFPYQFQKSVIIINN
jgi:hypothetical protein